MVATFDRVDLYTQALNTAFVNSFQQKSDPVPLDQALTIVPSKGRIENYPWLYPAPQMTRWKGYRKLAKLGETNYRVPNITWSAGFEVPFEDLEDDQIDGFKLQAAGMGAEAKDYHRIEVLQTLALGKTTACFDGSYFFADSHTIGTGDNTIVGTTAATDGVTHAMVFLVTSNKMVKPLLWQTREQPDFKTDAGDNVSNFNRMVKYWSSMRGAAAFGFWWDAVLVTFANTPTVAEMQTTLGTVNARLRSFTYPKNLPDEPSRYFHANTAFSTSNALIITSTLIEHVVRQALTLSLIGATENVYKGFANLAVAGYLDSVT